MSGSNRGGSLLRTHPELAGAAPPGTAASSCILYKTTMYLLAGLLRLAFVANALVRPIAAYHFRINKASRFRTIRRRDSTGKRDATCGCLPGTRNLGQH